MNLPKVLVLASQKGGVGKTCLTAHLGVCAEMEGVGPVAYIDVDPQGSLSEWWNRRKADVPLFAKGGLNVLPETLRRCAEGGVKLVVIDTPPASTDSLGQVVKHADYVLIPTQDGISDISAISRTVEMVKELRKPFSTVLTFINKRTTQYADATRILSRGGPIAAVVSYRVMFKKADNDGQTVQEIEPNGAAAKEIAELWQFVGEEMGLVVRARKEKELV